MNKALAVVTAILAAFVFFALKDDARQNADAHARSQQAREMAKLDHLSDLPSSVANKPAP